MIHLETERLILRDWEPEDLKPFAAMNQDPIVTEFLIPLTEEQAAERIQHYQKHIQEYGFGFFACELKEAKQFIGFIGLAVSHPDFKTTFSPFVEIGWRLAKEYWGNGYATEGAKALLHKGFTDYALDEIVSFTVRENIRSRRVMEKIGLTKDSDGVFQHPMLSKDHPLSWHVLYRLTKEQYKNFKRI
jgi:RimJ/RimL family protein N-acetyltransferase